MMVMAEISAVFSFNKIYMNTFFLQNISLYIPCKQLNLLIFKQKKIFFQWQQILKQENF